MDGHTKDDTSVGEHATLVRMPNDDELAPSAPTRISQGTQLGRYVVLGRLGSGGMGVVYTAWDPQLDRKLALKLLDAKPDRAQTQGRARLLREAQAMARLVHPNVVAIHDVGTVDDQVFIAMEFVDGESLRDWLGGDRSLRATGQRPCSEILAVFIAAGRGLEAAHAAGLIHRDFKPDNVMVGADGRVRVLDFGLARRGDDIEEPQSERSSVRAGSPSAPGSATVDDSLGSLTRTGVLIGTPAYMSPEQFRGDPLDARSDQFSFCVALWEALAGERPFPGARQIELISAVTEGRRCEFPRGSRVPEAAIRALERGLASSPQARWPDMSSLLDALAPPATSPRRPWIRVGVVSLVLGLGVSAGLVMGDDNDDADPISCEVDDARLDGVWDETRAAALERAFAATGLPWAQASGARIREHFDAWTDAWRAGVQDTCEDHYLRHEQSAAIFDLRMACLDQRLRAFNSLVGLLSAEQLEAGVAEQALSAALALESVVACSEPERLSAKPVIEDPKRAAAIVELEAGLDRREQIQDLGQYSRGLEEGERLRDALETLEHPASWSRYWRLRALDLELLGEPDEALEAATMAISTAGRDGTPQTTLNAVIVLVRITLKTDRIDESERWLEFGEAIGEQIPEPWFHYELLKAHGFLAATRGQQRAAAQSFSDALDLARETFGPDSIEVAFELSNYGHAASQLGADDPAMLELGLAAQREAVATTSRLLAAEHPTALTIHFKLIATMLNSGRADQALTELERLEPILVASYESDDSLRRVALRYRVWTYERLGRCDAAFAELDASLAWVNEFRGDDPKALIIAQTLAAAACVWSHPQSGALLDLAVATVSPDGAPPTSELGIMVLANRALERVARRSDPDTDLDAELERAAAELELARQATPPGSGTNWQPPVDLDLIGDLLVLTRDPSDEAARVRVLTARAELNTVYEHGLILLVDRVLADPR